MEPGIGFLQYCLNRRDQAALALSAKHLLFAVLFLWIISAFLSFPSVSSFSSVFLAVSPTDLFFLSVLSISSQIHYIPLELLCIHVGLPYSFFFNA